MKSSKFDAPLAEAAARSLRRAAQIARERAAQTGVPLVVWREGKIVREPVTQRQKSGRKLVSV